MGSASLFRPRDVIVRKHLLVLLLFALVLQTHLGFEVAKLNQVLLEIGDIPDLRFVDASLLYRMASLIAATSSVAIGLLIVITYAASFTSFSASCLSSSLNESKRISHAGAIV
jgi:hypothetical protein